MRAPNASAKPGLIVQLEVEYWVNLPLEIIEKRIGMREAKWKIYYAILRCSFALPFFSPFAIRPRLRSGGFVDWVVRLQRRIGEARPIRPGEINDEMSDTDQNGKEIPLSQADLSQITGITKGHVSEAIAGLRADGLLGQSWPFYVLAKPTASSSAVLDPKVPLTKNLLAQKLSNALGIKVTCTGNSEGTAQTLEEVSTAWKAGLQKLRTDCRNMLEKASAANGILIGKERRSKIKKKGSPFLVSECWEEPAQEAYPPTSRIPSTVDDSEKEPTPEVALVEEFCGKFEPGDPLLQELENWSSVFGIPRLSIRACIADKIKEKTDKRYIIWSAGALLAFVRPFLLLWIRQNGPLIESHRKWESPGERESGFPAASIRVHLTACADAVRKRFQEPPFSNIADELDRLSASAGKAKTKELEQHLVRLENSLCSALRDRANSEEFSALEGDVKRELQPYREKMAPEQIAALERRQLTSMLLERARMPRLSLFYVL